MGEQQSASRGRLVGRYVVHDRIAAGGMATVHVGRLLGAAASRAPSPSSASTTPTRRTRSSSRCSSTRRAWRRAIRHPNVVPTLDVVAEDGELLVVMEYVEGDSRRAPHQASRSGAGAAHARSRSRQPSSRRRSTACTPRTRLATRTASRSASSIATCLRRTSSSASTASRACSTSGSRRPRSRATATEDGQIKGKTAYMAPEQLQHGAVDRRTDIFAAAVVLWELFCGRRLFFADSPAETMSRVLTLPIDPPQKYAPELPSELAAITLRGLDRDPAGRFATAEEMALAIEESIAMPRSKDVGAWVATTAKAILEGRAQLVHAVEQASHKMPSAAPTSDPGLARAIEEAERRRENAELPTDVGAKAPRREPRRPAPPGEEGTALSTVQSTSTMQCRRPRARGPRSRSRSAGACRWCSRSASRSCSLVRRSRPRAVTRLPRLRPSRSPSPRRAPRLRSACHRLRATRLRRRPP